MASRPRWRPSRGWSAGRRRMPCSSSDRRPSARRRWPRTSPPDCCARRPIAPSRPCRACRACRLVAPRQPSRTSIAWCPEGPGGQVVIGDGARPGPRAASATCSRISRSCRSRAAPGSRSSSGAGPMNEDAQNALLKTLEEPPRGRHDRALRRPRGAAPAHGPSRCARDPARAARRPRDRGAARRARARRRARPRHGSHDSPAAGRGGAGLRPGTRSAVRSGTSSRATLLDLLAAGRAARLAAAARPDGPWPRPCRVR